MKANRLVLGGVAVAMALLTQETAAKTGDRGLRKDQARAAIEHRRHASTIVRSGSRA